MGKCCLHASSFIFEQIIIKVAGNQVKARMNSISGLWFPWPIYMFFEMRGCQVRLDSGERSLPFGLGHYLLHRLFDGYRPRHRSDHLHHFDLIFLCVYVTGLQPSLLHFILHLRLVRFYLETYRKNWNNSDTRKKLSGIIIGAASSDFVSSSIPSWQILTAHAQPFRGARDLAFCLKVPLDSLHVWASSGGSGETARMRRLAWTFAARIDDKYQICLTRPME